MTKLEEMLLKQNKELNGVITEILVEKDVLEKENTELRNKKNELQRQIREMNSSNKKSKVVNEVVNEI